MLARAASAAPARVLRAAVADLVGELRQHDARESGVRMCLDPGNALDRALVELHLRDMGHGEPGLEPLLADLLGPRRLFGPERPPNRELEQSWLAGLWSGGAGLDDIARRLRDSCLAREFDHLAATTDDAYAFTHAILYASDNGRLEARLPRSVAAIEADAEAILAAALDAGNHDVAAEVLWTWPMLHRPMSAFAAIARDFLSSVAQRWGFLPGPGFDPAIHRQLSDADRDSYVLRTSYHTAVAHGLFLAAALLRDGAAGSASDRPRTRNRATPSPGASDELLSRLADSPLSADWRDHVRSLPAAARDGLAPDLLTMALRRAARGADLRELAAALELATWHRIKAGPAVRQAEDLLRRSVLCARLPDSSW